MTRKSEERKQLSKTLPSLTLLFLLLLSLSYSYLAESFPSWEKTWMVLGASLGAIIVGIYWDHPHVRLALLLMAIFFASPGFFGAWRHGETEEKRLLAVGFGLFLLLTFWCAGCDRPPGDENDDA